MLYETLSSEIQSPLVVLCTWIKEKVLPFFLKGLPGVVMALLVAKQHLFSNVVSLLICLFILLYFSLKEHCPASRLSAPNYR